MAIVDDYAGIAAELRHIQAERTPQEPVKQQLPVVRYITRRGVIQVDIGPGPPLKRPVLARCSWTTD